MSASDCFVAGLDINADVVVIESIGEASPSSSPREVGVKREPDEFHVPTAKRMRRDSSVLDEQDVIQARQYPLVPYPEYQHYADDMSSYKEHLIAFFLQQGGTAIPPPMLKEQFSLLLAYCVANKVYNLSLRDFPKLLCRTGLRMFSLLVGNGTASSSTRAILNQNPHGVVDMHMEVSPATSNSLLNLILNSQFPYNTAHHLVCTFVDYATHGPDASLSSEGYQQCINVLSNPVYPFVENMLVKLGQSGLPEELSNLSSPLLSLVALLMHCRACAEQPEDYTNEERLLHAVFTQVSETVLSDMFLSSSVLRPFISSAIELTLESWPKEEPL